MSENGLRSLCQMTELAAAEDWSDPPKAALRLPFSDVPPSPAFDVECVLSATLKQAPKPQKRKWARVQCKELSNVKFQRMEGQYEYNIWYNRYSSDFHEKRYKASTRCDSKRDAGLTRADLVNPDNAYICIFFAKGSCAHGRRCQFLHRVPTDADNAKLDSLHDCFGRERHATDRDDMGGIGSFTRDCRTLFVGSLQISNIRRLEESLLKHFGEWGEIEQLVVKPKYGCAFVRYKNRANAEFAKIAMSEQSLDQDEQLNIRWAHDDPNPRVIRELQVQREEKVATLIKAQGYEPAAVVKPYLIPKEYQQQALSLPNASDIPTEILYPSTDNQYNSST